MTFDQHLIVRVKAFLNASDLTDSATARELYDAYRKVNDAMARRVVECGLLLRKNQKIEAVLEARRAPELFETIDAMLFPERKLFAELADLYDWPHWDELDMKTVADLRAAVKGMDDLRPLLTEFRRIARTDQLEAKLQLLRDIYRMDNRNPEWREALSEVENQYLFRLIAEAQQVIEAKDEERLLAIHEELHRPVWLVSVPTIVMQKIDRIAEEIGQRRLREQSAALVDRIVRAHKELDTAALEDALLGWEGHCRSTGYRPDRTESQQIDAAKDRLAEEKRKLAKRQEFQRKLEEIGALIDRQAPLHEVENLYAAAEAMGHEIPALVTDRVKKYRGDILRSRRIAAVLKVVRIVAAAVILLAVAGGVTLLTLQFISEKKLTAELNDTIRSGDLTKAQSMIADIEAKSPRLAKSARVLQAKAEITKRIEEEKTRVGELDKTLGELKALLSKDKPDRNAISSKLSHARELARNEYERKRINEYDERSRLLFESMRKADENRFNGQIEKLRNLRDDAVRSIANGKKTGDFDPARAKLDEIDKLVSDIQDLSEISDKLRNDNEDLLSSGITLRQELNQTESRFRNTEQCLDDISNARDIPSLESALDNLKQMLQTDGESAEELKRLNDKLTRDLKTFKAIENYQNGQGSLDDGAVLKSGFFADAATLTDCRNAQRTAAQRLVKEFQNIRQRTNRETLHFVRMLDQDRKKLDFYVTHGVIIDETKCVLKRSDGARVTIKKPWSFSEVTVEFTKSLGGNATSEKFSGCELVFPKSLDRSDTIYDSVAPHQRIIDAFYEKLQDTDDANILQTGIAFLKKLYSDPMCSPYWKMQLSRRVLAALIPLDRSPDGELKKIDEGFRQIDDSGSADPVYNRELLEKIDSYIAENCTAGRLDRVTAVNELLLRRLRLTVERKFVFLGVFLNRKNAHKNFSIKGDPAGVAGDVWCFDKSNYGCRIVGSFHGSELIPGDNFASLAEGRLLFTTSPSGNMADETGRWLKDPAAAELKSMDWPKFWPVNLLEE